MAATDDGDGGNPGGVLGNLPRSRPGQRSDKRGDLSLKPSAGGQSTMAAPGGPPGVAEDVGRLDEPSSAGEAPAGGPLGGAVRVAGRAARFGLDAAGGVLKRLPRP